MNAKRTTLTYAAVVGVLCSGWACLTTTSTDDTPREVLISLTETVILPRFENLVDSASNTEAAVLNFCAAPDATGLEGVRESWKSLRSAWRQLEPFYFGPHSRIPTRYGRVLDFWPVRESKINELLASEDPIDGEIIGGKGAVVRGIPALEYILFGSPADALLEMPPQNKTCLVAQAMSEDIHNLSRDLRNQWTSDPDRFSLALTEPESGEFMDVRGALSEVVNRMGFTIENMRVDRLGTPLGDKVGGEQLLPDSVESRYSNHSLEDLRQVLVTIETLFEGSDIENSYGLIDMPRIRSRQDIIDSFRQSLTAARAAINAIPEPLKESLDQTQVVRSAYDRLGDLQRVIQGDVINVLGLSLAFNDADGD